MDAFDTLTLSDEGVKMELDLPNGKRSGQTVTILGSDSEKFQNALAISNRKSMSLIAEREKSPPEKVRKEQKEEQRWLAAHLVSDWSFDQECNLNNVIEFFKKAPQIQDAIDTFSDDRENYMNQSFNVPPTS